MKPIYRWIAAHPRLSKFVITAFITVLFFFLLDPNIFPFLLRFLIIFLSLVNGFLFVNTMPERLMKEPLEILEQQCDPYPLLAEMERQLPLCKEDLQGQLTRINYAMALSQTGQYETALQILEAIDIDRFPGTSPVVRYVYCNHLCDLLTRLDRFPEADGWYHRAQQIYEQIPGSRLKQRMEYNVTMNDIEALYREGDYASALRRLSRLSCKTQRSLMSAALLAARCNLKQEEYEKAREKLQYIITNGNKLFAVEEAKQLLSTLP